MSLTVYGEPCSILGSHLRKHTLTHPHHVMSCNGILSSIPLPYPVTSTPTTSHLTPLGRQIIRTGRLERAKMTLTRALSSAPFRDCSAMPSRRWIASSRRASSTADVDLGRTSARRPGCLRHGRGPRRRGQPCPASSRKRSNHDPQAHRIAGDRSRRKGRGGLDPDPGDPGGSFSRSLTLPDGLEADKATATFEDGVLTLRIPKAEQVKPRTESRSLPAMPSMRSRPRSGRSRQTGVRSTFPAGSRAPVLRDQRRGGPGSQAHPRTLRIYEDEGLLSPARSDEHPPLLENDIRRILWIRRLTQERGVNLRG